MSPTNPFSSFNPQQASQLMQQQRALAFQRQVQEQLQNQHMPGSNRSSDNRPDLTRPDMSRSEMNRSDMARPDLTRSDMSRADISRQDMNRQYSSPSGSISGSSTGNGPNADSANFNQNSQDGFPGGFSPQSRPPVSHATETTNSDLPTNQVSCLTPPPPHIALTI